MGNSLWGGAHDCDKAECVIKQCDTVRYHYFCFSQTAKCQYFCWAGQHLQKRIFQLALSMISLYTSFREPSRGKMLVEQSQPPLLSSLSPALPRLLQAGDALSALSGNISSLFRAASCQAVVGAGLRGFSALLFRAPFIPLLFAASFTPAPVVPNDVTPEFTAMADFL